MSHDPIRVLCIDDHAFLAEGLRSRFALERDLELVDWHNSAEDLAGRAEQARAQVVLLDIDMPGPDPFESLEGLSRFLPDVRVIILSAHVRDHYVDSAVQAGAWGYVSKSDSPDEVIEAVRKVMRGEFAFGPRVLESCQPAAGFSGARTHGGSGEKPVTKLSQLTPRELQVLRLIGKGMGRTDIARELHRSVKTIDNHRAAIMEKLGIHDRAELVRYAIREGLTEA